ncbi:hypothetical protein BDW60DRAFT_181029 [Aspergillus nidulans var. acristatus]
MHLKLPVFTYFVKCHKSWYHASAHPPANNPLQSLRRLSALHIPPHTSPLFLRFHVIIFLFYTVISRSREHSSFRILHGALVLAGCCCAPCGGTPCHCSKLFLDA